MRKHDGWMIKRLGEKSYLCTGFFHVLREDVIKDFEGLFGKGSWRKKRGKGEFKIVKVRFVEGYCEESNLPSKN